MLEEYVICEAERSRERAEDSSHDNGNREISFEQGSEDWHKWRNNHLGSSDAAVVLGCSPWKTPYQLWKEKVNNLPPEESTPAMKRGLFLEKDARQAHFEMTGIFTVARCIESKAYPFIAASLDGLNLDGSVVLEIKCPNAADHQLALEGKVPDKYYPQVQHQLFVSGAKECHYFSFDGSFGALVRVEPDQEFIAHLIEKEVAFWKMVTNLEPPPLTEADYIDREDDEWARIAHEFIMLDSEEKNIAARKKEMREKILSLAEGQNCRGAGVRVRYQKKEGGLDLERLSKVVDIAEYRKPPSFFPVVGIDLKSGEC